MQNLNCFKVLDIRGKVGSEIDAALCYNIGIAFAEFTKAKSVVIGGDARLSTPQFKQAIMEGLLAKKVKVFDIGFCGTEEIYFATSHLQTDGGIMVTASHNPIDYNGLKFVGKNSVVIAKNSGLEKIKALVLKHQETYMPNALSIEQVNKISILDAYTEKLISFINPLNFKKKLTILTNSGNGMAGHVLDALQQKFITYNIPIEFINILHQADGTFPNGIPNPLLATNRQTTIDAIKQHNIDFAIAFDGDFDRCFLFDAKGNFIDGYYIVGLLAQQFLTKHQGAPIVFEPRLIWDTQDIIKNYGGIPVLSVSGHSFIKQKMREKNALYGGEISAHHYFRDFYYCDSGMLPWLLIAEIISNQQTSLSRLIHHRMQLFPISGEINLKVTNPNKVISTVEAFFAPQAQAKFYFDGLNMEFENWRFNLRFGNTEPILRLNVETKANPELLKIKTNEVLTIIKQSLSQISHIVVNTGLC